jgi:predicted molibdopterin-dependent oxidoreductase YjgC
MFRRITEAETTLTFTFDGQPVRAVPGDSVAAALLGAGIRAFRSSVVSGAPRGPHCLMGACFECLVTIDGAANRQSCMVEATEGMDVRSQHGPRPVDAGGRP